MVDDLSERSHALLGAIVALYAWDSVELRDSTTRDHDGDSLRSTSSFIEEGSCHVDHMEHVKAVLLLKL